MSAYFADTANPVQAAGQRPASIGAGPAASPLFENISTAFQPIVDMDGTPRVFAHEALVRGVGGEGAYDVFSRTDHHDRYALEHACRHHALHWAARLALPGRLSLNISPNSMTDPCHGVRATLATAADLGVPTNRLIFEITEQEPVRNYHSLRRLAACCRKVGALIAIDDFGAGYAALTPLVEIRPDIIKLDMDLVRNIDSDPMRRAMVGAISQACGTLGILLVAEGVETRGEMLTLRAEGISLMQGYLFARPALECLPVIQNCD